MPYTPYGQSVAPNQFTDDDTLTASEAASACGPAMAVAFARVNGRNPTLSEAVKLARRVGWSPQTGMAGPGWQVRLMELMGVGASLDPNADDAVVRGDVVAKRPVGISTAKHYYFADGYDDQTGKYHVGATGKVRIGGSDWMGLDEIRALDGGINGVIRVSQPAAPEDGMGVSLRRQPDELIPFSPASRTRKVKRKDEFGNEVEVDEEEDDPAAFSAGLPNLDDDRRPVIQQMGYRLPSIRG